MSQFISAGPPGPAGGVGNITDGVTTVNPATKLTFTTGAQVTDGGAGNAQVAITAVPTFKGALITKVGSTQLAPGGTATLISFDSIVYDHGGWVVGNTLVVPAGVTRVRAYAGFLITSAENCELFLGKNGAGYKGQPQMGIVGPGLASLLMLASPPLEVVLGDVFNCGIVNNGTNTNISNAGQTYLAIEAVPG